MHTFYNRLKNRLIISLSILFSVSILKAQISTDGLVAYYPFSGNANDESGNGYNPVYANATLSSDRFGNSNNAYSFDGVDDYIDLGDILDDVFCKDTAQFSISGWAYTNNYNPTEGNLIIGKSAGGSGPYQWSISHNYGTIRGQVFTDASAGSYFTQQTTLNTNEWVHFVLIFDGEKELSERTKLFINNTLVSSGSIIGTPGTSTENTGLHLTIGGQNYFSSTQSLYDGIVDDIRIYNRPLTQAEVNSLYHEDTGDIPPAVTTFCKTYGGTGIDKIVSLIATPDSGYAAVGSSNSCMLDNTEVCILKTDSLGTLLWAKTFGDNGNENGYAIEAADNGYMVIGSCQSKEHSSDFFVARTDLQGNIICKRTYGGIDEEQASVLKKTKDGNYIIAGSTKSYGAGGWDGFLMKINGNGDVLWFKTYGTILTNQAYQVLEDSDGSFVVTGTDYDGIQHDLMVLKTDSSGNLFWAKKYVIPNHEGGWRITKTKNGDYLIVSDSGPAINNRAALIYRIDNNGNLRWVKSYRSPTYGMTFNRADGVLALSDGGIVIAGQWAGYGLENSTSGFIMKTDDDGNVIWSREYSSSTTAFWTLYQALDGGFVLGGLTNNSDAGGNDCYLVKTDTNGAVGSTGTLVNPIVEILPATIEDVIIISNSYSISEVLGQFSREGEACFYTSYQPSNSLVAFYPFNGNANDESGNGNNAICINATLTSDRFGKDSSAYYFDGVNNYIDFGDILDDVFCKDIAQFSISGWAKTEVMGNVYGEGNLIIGKTAGGIGPYQWSVSHNSGMLFGGIFPDSALSNYRQYYLPMNANNWFHFVLIFDGTQPAENRMRVIVNNNSSMQYWSGAGTLGTGTENTSLHMYVGGQTHYFNTLQNRYNGTIDDIRIYNRVLAGEEIQNLFLEGGWDPVNSEPIADAGPDQIAFIDSVSFAIVTLDGSASYDEDRDTLTYTWKLADTTLVTGVNPTIQLPLGSHTITLIVSDKKGGLDMDQVVITVYNIPKVRVAFTLNVGGPVYAGISALGDNAIYVVASGDAIYKMNTTGNVAYTIQVAGDIRSSSSIAYDTTVYIGSSDKNLYAFSKEGNSVWPPLPTGGVLTATPTIDSVLNCIYIGVSNKNFIAVNRLTGTVEWNFFANDQIWNSAVVTKDRKLVFATLRGTLYGFDLKNLTLPAAPSWQISLPGEAPSSIASDNEGYIYIGTGSGSLLKISLPDGQQPSIEWQTELNGSISGSPVIDGTGTIYVGSSDANLYAIDNNSGEIKWTFSTNGGIRSTPVISEAGNIYLANDIGEVISLDKDKNIIWYYKISSAVVAPLTYYKSTLYIGTLGNQVIALCDAADSVQARYLLKSAAEAGKKPIWATFQGNNQRTGMFSYSSAGSSEITNPNFNLPTEYTLYQNYPNPFNPSTTIQYTMPKEGKISIKIYNIIGKHIATIVDGYQQAGYHTVVFNMDNFASGIYFYQMRTGSFTDTKKMIIMK